MENKIVAIVQARLTSKRFPKKIIQKIGESTLIEQVIKRVKLSKKIDDVILAVPNNDKHKILKKYFNKNKINKIIKFMSTDKKNKGSSINLVLLKRISKVILHKEYSKKTISIFLKNLIN